MVPYERFNNDDNLIKQSPTKYEDSNSPFWMREEQLSMFLRGNLFNENIKLGSSPSDESIIFNTIR